ncbi:hypothetical protein VPH35_088216 [Triticum aestivum]|uniref:CASP-like protein n=3 Tax=Triticum TaxID=4564 RepID=A0A9R0WZP6_TRITD|nr:CASP-like protein 1B2 [Triticum aestivum]VAI27330.1 unnamed protein product [Triticum turgidum subsp. durum]
MDLEHGKKPPAIAAAELCSLKDKLVGLRPVLLRAAAVLATAVAAVVMGLNRQSYTAVVAIVGTRPLRQTFTAKFSDTPAFVYFVIANSIASLYNLVVLLLRRCIVQGRAQHLVVHRMDMVIMVLLATGAATAASMAELGKNGNLHTRWNPICNKFGSFCNRGGVSLVFSFVGVALMLAMNLLSAAANSPRAVVAGQ